MQTKKNVKQVECDCTGSAVSVQIRIGRIEVHKHQWLDIAHMGYEPQTGRME